MGDTTSWSRLRAELYSLFGRNPKSNRIIATVAALESDQIVLDIGCGPGAAVRAGANHVARAVGVDRSEAMISIARRRSAGIPNVEFLAAGAEDLPFPDATFDRVWTIHAFHHWEDEARGVAECFRVLKPGGKLLIIESDTKGSHGLDRSGAQALAGQLGAAGFADSTVGESNRQVLVTGVR